VNSRQYAKAIDAFRRSAELNPAEVTLFVSIGYNCGELNRYSEAIEAYSQALQLKPDFAIGWYNIGLFHLHQRHYRDAIAAAEKALAIVHLTRNSKSRPSLTGKHKRDESLSLVLYCCKIAIFTHCEKIAKKEM
jgi:tetratricopeptide (TPR) repeat protein